MNPSDTSIDLGALKALPKSLDSKQVVFALIGITGDEPENSFDDQVLDFRPQCEGVDPTLVQIRPQTFKRPTTFIQSHTLYEIRPSVRLFVVCHIRAPC